MTIPARQAALEAPIRTWLLDAMGGSVEVIFADQGAPRPATPYASVKLTGLRGIGMDDRGDITDPGAPAQATQTLQGDRVLTASVQVFGAGALDNARVCSNALNMETALDKLRAAGLGPRPPGPVDELTALEATDFEERAQFDVEFGFAEQYDDTVGLIEKVQGEGKLKSAHQERTVTFEASKS